MLRYDAAWLIEWYHAETVAVPHVPYTKLAGDGPFSIRREPGTFALAPVLDISPQLDYDETVVRLTRFEEGTLWVQPCAYSDGVKSNYAMDGPGDLRAALRDAYGGLLPPLGDARLSNGIGTAVVVTDGDGRAYLPRRAPRQSVYPGGYQCTASGEAVWRDGNLDFDGLFTANIRRELEEEVGITRADLEWIRPVAFCREFLRGGKPQFFFAAHTRLGEDALAERRRAAIARQIAAGRQEVMDEALFVVRPEEVRPGLCTMECAANLALIAPTRHR
jgi:hypothetical protein